MSERIPVDEIRGTITKIIKDSTFTNIVIQPDIPYKSEIIQSFTELSYFKSAEDDYYDFGDCLDSPRKDFSDFLREDYYDYSDVDYTQFSVGQRVVQIAYAKVARNQYYGYDYVLYDEYSYDMKYSYKKRLK